MTRSNTVSTLIATLLLLTATALTSPALAQEYTRLQIILPGETPAPGTTSGKLGTPTSQVVDTAFQVIVRACDDGWQLVDHVTSRVQLESSDASALLPGPFDLVGGEATVTVTSRAAGSFTFIADDLTDLTIGDAQSAPVTVLQLQGFEFSRINQKNQYAGQPMAITLNAIDPAGNLVTGFSGQVQLQQLTSYGDGRIEPSVVTLQNGTWSGSITMFRADQTSINRGNVNVYAFLPQDPSRNGTSDPFTVHPGTYDRLHLVVPGQIAAPGSVSGVLGNPASQGSGDTFQVTVYSTDAYWNPVPSGDQVRLTSSDGAASTPVNGTLVNGQTQLSVALGTVGQQTLTIANLTSGSIDGMTSPPIPVTSGAVDQFVIEGITSPLTAGVPVTVTIRAADLAGNTITDYDGDGVLTANTGPGSISPAAVTFVDGVWTGPITFRGAGGAVALSCSDYSSPPHTGTSAPFVVQAGPYVGLQIVAPGQSPAGGTASGVTGSPDDQAAGSSFDVRVRAVDQFFNRVPGNTASVALRSSDPNAEFPESISLVNGEATVAIRLFAAGEQTVAAADAAADGIVSHESDEITVVAGPYARLVLIAPGEQLAPGTEEGRSGAATDQSINFSFTVRVYATDAWGNPVGQEIDVVRLTSNDLLAELPGETAMVDGMATLVVRLSTGGFQQLTASNVSRPSILPSTTQVRAISSGLHLEATVSPDFVRAGEPFTLTVRVTNDAGSVIQEINSSVRVETRNASSQDQGRGRLLNTEFQLLQGQRTVSQTYTAAEDVVFVISDDAGNTPAVTNVLRVAPGPPDAIELTSDPTWVRGAREATLSARLVDEFGNGVPDRPMAFLVLAGDGEIEAVDDSTNADGVASAVFHAPREPEIGRVGAVSGVVTAELAIETALVDPSKPAGSVTNYPNPFHPGEAPTTVAYKIADDATVRLRLFTLMGNLVRDEVFEAGRPGGVAGLNEWQWDGRNGEGEIVASGGYILQIDATGNGETLHTMRRKIAVVR